ncbi:MAG TPA: phosphate ABC transporter substrate-binding protein PstS [Burkholderiaceae bacterium]|nr:phosphate ABC transporter substrate-binding protein PstS [Burkholderiaceae bacterium]
MKRTASLRLLRLCLVLAAGALGSSAQSAVAAEVTGAGSSFVYPLLSQWSSDYANATGTRINYTSIGSGAGIAQIKAATIDFGASDKPLGSEELAQFGLAQFPIIIGGVVPVVNLEGVGPGELRLDGETLSRIYLGTITQWSDPAIAALNPGRKLPADPISVVHRSDGSGTTYNFVNYLSKVSNDWRSRVGEGTSVQWPVGVGGKGNEGVAAYVKQIKNSIGYVELEYALKTSMSYTALKNHAGKFVEPGLDSFAAAAASANWEGAKDFNLVITDAPGADAWPIAASVFVIVYRQPKDAARSKAAFEFFRWALEKGQIRAKELNYVALPKPLVQNIEKYWASEIK